MAIFIISKNLGWQAPSGVCCYWNAVWKDTRISRTPLFSNFQLHFSSIASVVQQWPNTDKLTDDVLFLLNERLHCLKFRKCILPQAYFSCSCLISFFCHLPVWFLFNTNVIVFISLHLSFGTQCCLRKKRANRDITLPEWVAYKQEKQRDSKRRGPYSASFLPNRWAWHRLTSSVDTCSELTKIDFCYRIHLFFLFPSSGTCMQFYLLFLLRVLSLLTKFVMMYFICVWLKLQCPSTCNFMVYVLQTLSLLLCSLLRLQQNLTARPLPCRPHRYGDK